MIQKVAPTSELCGTIHLPADKSISHRAGMFAALHSDESNIRNFSEAADPHSTLQCLRQLGVSIEIDGTKVTVQGVGRDGFQTPGNPLDCGNSGTTMRLLSGIVAGAGIPCTLSGDESLSARTMKRIINPLKKMGIEIKARDNDYAPLKISRNQPVKAIDYPLPIASAQLKSCVLLAGLFGEDKTRVMETKVSRDHTERLLQLPVKQRGETKTIRSSQDCYIPEQSYRVPGDFSAAAFWLVAGSIHSNAEIALPSVGINPTRTGALGILQKMGAHITIENEHVEGFEPVADIRVASSQLSPVQITEDQVPNCIDELPILLVAMLFADGESSIRGAGELRHKETDRLAAMADILERAGAKFNEHEDGFTIYGNPDFRPSPSVFASEDDHRIAMSAAVLGLMASSESKIQGAGCTRISYPTFWNDLALLTN